MTRNDSIEHILEVYAATFGVYRDFSLSDPYQATDLAQQLCGAGLPVQAYRLIGAKATELDFPFIAEHHREGWKLFLPPEGKSYGLPDELLLEAQDRGALGDKTIIVGEPPAGQPIQVSAVDPDGQPGRASDVEIFVFYAATSDTAELAEEQLLADLEALFNQARQEGKQLIFIDAVGLIPEETVKRYGEDEEAAFQKAFDSILRETEGIKEGIPPCDEASPLWAAVWKFLAERRVHSVLEELTHSLWKEIVEFDRQQLADKAFSRFIMGQLDGAARTMVQQMRGFHDLNCWRRNLNLARQIEELVENANGPLSILIGREIGHYGVLEQLLSSKYLLHSKILGHERLPLLLKNPVLETSLLGNLGVELAEEDLELLALRHCLKSFVMMSQQGKGLREMALMFAECKIDDLSRDDIEALIEELHDPTRVYLRNQGQHILDQFMYLLKDKGVISGEFIGTLQGL